MSLLRLAIEGQEVEVVTGMFVPVYLSEDAQAIQNVQAALESLDRDIEAVDETAPIQDIDAILMNEKTQSEVALEGIKDVFKKIIEMILKAYAALNSILFGIIRWITKGRRARRFDKEIYKAYLDLVTLYTKSGVHGSVDSYMKNIMKVDGYGEAFNKKLSPTQKHMLASDVYMRSLKPLIETFVGNKFSHVLKELGDDIGKNYKTLLEKAVKADEQNVPLKDFKQEADKQMQALTQWNLPAEIEAFEQYVSEPAAVLKNPKDYDINQAGYLKTFTALHDIMISTPFPKLMEQKPKYEKLFSDAEKSVEQAEGRFHSLEKSIGDDELSAQVYANRLILEAIRQYGRLVRAVAQGLSIIYGAWEAATGIADALIELMNGVMKSNREETLKFIKINEAEVNRMLANLKEQLSA